MEKTPNIVLFPCGRLDCGKFKGLNNFLFISMVIKSVVILIQFIITTPIVSIFFIMNTRTQ